MKSKRRYSYLIMNIAIAGVFSFIAFFSLNLNGDRFAEEFYSQNHQNIEAGNAFALIPQLNSLMHQDVIACIYAKTNGVVFFSSNAICERPILAKEIAVSSQGSSTILTFTYTLSKIFLVYLILAFLLTILSANLLLRMVYKVEDVERESLARINEMARSLAHDIRSPISTLNVVASAINSTNVEQSKLIKSVVENINSIANDLLMQSKGVTLYPEVPLNESRLCKVNDTIRGLVNEKALEYQERSVAANIIFRTTQVADDVAITLSKSEFSRILSNLINNSVEAALQNPIIYVDVTNHENMVHVTIEDFGRGIPPQIIDLLTRVPVSFGKKESSSGNGIGLFSANQTLVKIGGSIDVQSKLGIGTLITLNMPKYLALTD